MCWVSVKFAIEGGRSPWVAMMSDQGFVVVTIAIVTGMEAKLAILTRKSHSIEP